MIFEKILREEKLKKYIVIKNKKYYINLFGKERELYLRNDTSDIDVMYNIFSDELYSIKNKYNFNEKNIHIIIDLGANIGMSVLYFHIKFPNAKIIAIEPDKNNYNILLKNIQGIKNIIPLNCGIFNEKCKLSLFELSKGEWSLSSIKDDNGKIDSITMKELINKFNITDIDLLKVNIEGIEEELFSDSSFFDNVKNMYICLHDKYRYMCSKNLFKTIINYNYKLSVCDNLLVFYDIKKSIDKC